MIVINYSHKNIIEYCSRPFCFPGTTLPDIHLMNQTLTENWNSVVDDNDEVFCCGDFAWGNPKVYAEKLKGKKYLILGNHDKKSQCVPHFLEVFDSLQIEIAGRKVNLSHYPYKKELQNFKPDRFDKFRDRCLDNDGNWLIHGHVHNSMPLVTKKMINVSCENINYTPISESEIIKIMDSYD